MPERLRAGMESGGIALPRHFRVEAGQRFSQKESDAVNLSRVYEMGYLLNSPCEAKSFDLYKKMLIWMIDCFYSNASFSRTILFYHQFN